MKDIAICNATIFRLDSEGALETEFCERHSQCSRYAEYFANPKSANWPVDAEKCIAHQHRQFLQNKVKTNKKK